MMGIAAAFAALFVLLAQGGMAPERLTMLGQVTLAALALGVAFDVFCLLRRGVQRSTRVVPRRVRRQGPGRKPTIIVDGSNVLHWNGEPSQMVLTRVVKALVDKGERPHVYFDANVGYKLKGQFLGAPAMAAIIGLPARHVTVVDSGTPADPVLLDHAVRAGLRVVTNDRFLDWKSEYPDVGGRGFLVKGRWRQGTPMLRL